MQLNLSLLQRLASVSEEDRLDAEQKVKQRTLGNIRLIAELFNKGIVAEIIIIVCVEELIRNPKANSIEENVEVSQPACRTIPDQGALDFGVAPLDC